MRKVRNDWLSILLMGVLVLIVGVGLCVKFGMDRATAEEVLAKFPDRGVPRMNIALNGVTLDEIKEGSKETKYEGNGLALYEGSEVREFGNVRLKGRGNGTWIQEKKPYQIKFEKKVDLFGLGKAKKWVLLANAADASNLRTEMAFELARMLGMEYTFKGEFVELYFDGEYEGLYYLTHAVEIGKSTVDLKDPMGVLVELDNVYGDEEKSYKTRNDELLVVKDVVTTVNEDIAMEEFVKEFNELETTIAKKDYDKILSLVDIESFAKYYLLSEFSVNPDAYWTSFYFYKDGMDDKIHAGPGWDFDLAFANRNWGNWLGEAFYSSDAEMVRKNELLTEQEYQDLGLGEWFSSGDALSRIVFDLMEIPKFRTEVSKIYNEKMSGRMRVYLDYFSAQSDKIEEVAQYNSRKWGRGNYREEVNMMTKWMTERYEYFERQYGGNTV